MKNADVKQKLWERFVALFDRGRSRMMLSIAATRMARKHCQFDVEYIFDEVWLIRINDDYLALSDRFHFVPCDEDYVLDRIRDSLDYWFYVYKPSPGDVIIDVGAGDGRDTLLFSREVGAAGRVVSIEAHPLTYVSLQKLCKWNSVRNVTLLPCAVLDRECNVYIEDGQEPECNSVLLQDASSYKRRCYSVPAKSLDVICRENGIKHVDFLKMNIEGAERFAIEGARGIMSKTKHVCIACHDFLSDNAWYQTKEVVVKVLQESGFDIIARSDDDREYVRHHIHGIRR